MVKGPSGAAALRREAELGLRGAPRGPDPGAHLWPPRVLPFALAAAAVVGLSGTGLLPLAGTAALDLGGLLCYLAGVRSVLPRGGARQPWLRGMAPALLPTAAFVGAALLVAPQPGMPWVVVTPLWLLLVLAVCPWLEREGLGETTTWASTALAALTATVPVPAFVVTMSLDNPAPVLALGAGLGALVPSWALARLWGHRDRGAWERAAVVALLTAGAAALMGRLQVPGQLLPVAMLIGWYGLAGVATHRGRRQAGSYAAFVVLAAAIVAISSPV